MAIRFTDTEKWSDAWFANLSSKSKLLFLYLCDNCNLTGIIEINYNLWAAHTSLKTVEIKLALSEISKCYVISNDGECLFIRNFLKHQRNLPINTQNRAHIKILDIYENYRHKFDNVDIMALITVAKIRGIEGGYKEDRTPSSIGIGNSIGNSKEDRGVGEETWESSLEVYLRELGEAVERLKSDAQWIEKQSRLNPNVDVLLTIEKSVENFWATSGGWANKKKSRSKTIDWKLTMANAISLPSNRVYLQSSTGHPINQKLKKDTGKLAKDGRF